MAPNEAILISASRLSRIRLQNTQQAKSLLSPPLSLLYLFFSTNAPHTINIPIPYLGTLPSSLHLSLCVLLYPDRKEEKRDGERRRRSLISGAQSPLCFPIPRSSANVDCGRRGRSRVFAPPADRVNTLIDVENREEQTNEGEREIEKKSGGKLEAIERAGWKEQDTW